MGEPYAMSNERAMQIAKEAAAMGEKTAGLCTAREKYLRDAGWIPNPYAHGTDKWGEHTRMTQNAVFAFDAGWTAREQKERES